MLGSSIHDEHGGTHMNGWYPLARQLACRHDRRWRDSHCSRRSWFYHLQEHKNRYAHLQQSREPETNLSDDFIEWFNGNERAAMQQGWMVVETMSDNHAPYEIQRVDDAAGVGWEYGITIPQLASDREAVMAMRAAYGRGEYHAYLAREIIRRYSLQEFVDQHMARWFMSQPLKI